MNFDLQTITGFVIGSFAFPLGRFVYNAFTGANTAKSEATGIYQGLNIALEKKVDTLQEQLLEALHKIEIMDERITKLSNDNAFFEQIFHKALAEYFERHPDVASEHNRRKKPLA